MSESFAFSSDNEAAVRAILEKYPEGHRASALLPLLSLAQQQCGGWLPQPALDYVADYLKVPPIRAYEVASFYDMFNTRPVGRIQVRVCTTTPCWLCGSDDVLRACKDALQIGVGQSTPDGRFYLREFECLGACANAPMMWIDDDYYEDLDYESTRAIIDALMEGRTARPGSQTGRKASMPAGGKTTLRADPHRREPERVEGPGEPDLEPVDKGRPDDAVKEHAVEVEEKGRPADQIGETVAGSPEDAALGEGQEQDRAQGEPVDKVVEEGGRAGVPHDEAAGKGRRRAKKTTDGQDAS